MKQLKELFKYNDVGIFQKLFELDSSIKWLSSDIAKQLDIEYYYLHSGDKLISKYYENLLNLESKNIGLIALNEIAKTCINFNLTNWNNIFEAYNTSYSPLENYSMVENEEISSKVKNTIKTSSDVYGFDNENKSPSSEVNNESITEGSKDDNNRTLTRKGNIGVTTSQQMLKSELDLRIYIFYNEVMNDIDKIMCLKIY